MLTLYATYRNVSLITAPKIHTDLLWDLTMLFVSLAAVYFIGVFFFKNKLSSQGKTIRRKKNNLSPIISEFLFFEENSSKDEKTNYIKLKVEIRQFLKDSFNRRILSEVLLDLGKDVSGKTQESLFALYKELELHKDAYKKINSWRWEKISKGIYELTQMQVQESYGFLIQFINDKRSTIRKQAELATVTLKEEGISHFLDTTTYKISEWQQLKLLEILRNQKDYQPPKFKQWLTSGNKYVVLFSLRLIKHYNQNDAELSIIELVKHKNNQVKQEAIRCIKEFGFAKAGETLKLIFWNSTVDTKIAVLNALAVIGKEKDLPFLKQIELKERNFSVKSKAISTINCIAPESILPTKDIEKTLPQNIPEDIKTTIPQNHTLANTTMDTTKEPNEFPIKKEASNTEELKNVIQEIRTEELNSTLSTKPKEEAVNLDFLPIIFNEEETDTTSKETTPSVSDSKDLKDIAVDSETISAENIENFNVNFEEIEPYVNTEHTIEFNTDFIPFVTTKNEEAVNNLKCFYEEVPDIIAEDAFFNANKQEVEMDFIPFVYEHTETATTPSSVDSIDVEKTNAIPTIFEEVKQEEPLSTTPLDKLAPPNLNLESIPQMPEDKNLADRIPKPFFYNEEKLSLLRSLEDINTFGDAREIPLLIDYLNQEKEPFIKERILEILDEIQQKTTENLAMDMDTQEEKYTVEINLLEELFKNSDSESKLILLDEIVAVGDKKELKLLNKLLQDSDAAVRQKALVCIAKLQNQINTEEEKLVALVATELKQPIPLEYAFLSDYKEELSKNNIKPSLAQEQPMETSTVETKTKEKSFLEEFYTFSSKVLEKLNG